MHTHTHTKSKVEHSEREENEENRSTLNRITVSRAWKRKAVNNKRYILWWGVADHSAWHGTALYTNAILPLCPSLTLPQSSPAWASFNFSIIRCPQSHTPSGTTTYTHTVYKHTSSWQSWELWKKKKTTCQDDWFSSLRVFIINRIKWVRTGKMQHLRIHTRIQHTHTHKQIDAPARAALCPRGRGWSICEPAEQEAVSAAAGESMSAGNAAAS